MLPRKVCTSEKPSTHVLLARRATTLRRAMGASQRRLTIQDTTCEVGIAQGAKQKKGNDFWTFGVFSFLGEMGYHLSCTVRTCRKEESGYLPTYLPTVGDEQTLAIAAEGLGHAFCGLDLGNRREERGCFLFLVSSRYEPLLWLRPVAMRETKKPPLSSQRWCRGREPWREKLCI